MDDPNDELTGKVFCKDSYKIILTHNLRSLTAVFRSDSTLEGDHHCVYPPSIPIIPETGFPPSLFSYFPLTPLHSDHYFDLILENNEENIVAK